LDISGGACASSPGAGRARRVRGRVQLDERQVTCASRRSGTTTCSTKGEVWRYGTRFTASCRRLGRDHPVHHRPPGRRIEQGAGRARHRPHERPMIRRGSCRGAADPAAATARRTPPARPARRARHAAGPVLLLGDRAAQRQADAPSGHPIESRRYGDRRALRDAVRFRRGRQERSDPELKGVWCHRRPR